MSVIIDSRKEAKLAPCLETLSLWPQPEALKPVESFPLVSVGFGLRKKKQEKNISHIKVIKQILLTAVCAFTSFLPC